MWATSIETKAGVVGLGEDAVGWSCDEGGEKNWVTAFVNLSLLVGNIRIVKTVIPGIYTSREPFKRTIVVKW